MGAPQDGIDNPRSLQQHFPEEWVKPECNYLNVVKAVQCMNLMRKSQKAFLNKQRVAAPFMPNKNLHVCNKREMEKRHDCTSHWILKQAGMLGIMFRYIFRKKGVDQAVF